MKALVLEERGRLSIREIAVDEKLGIDDVRIEIKACGICGSDVHYYKEGRIGDFVVKEPMILGHEAAGVVTEVGSAVSHIKVGDRVCMEPGVPTANSRETIEGNYNLDPRITFWATPPDHGVMRGSVVHPAAFTFKLPEKVSFQEGAMVEPFAIGIEAAKNGEIVPGDVALVMGAGPIGIMTALAALAGGCSKVIVADVVDEKLKIATSYDGVVGVNVRESNLLEKVREETKDTNSRGVDVLFEATGNATVFKDMFRCCSPGARVVLVGMMNEPAPIDVPLIQVLGLSIVTVFRYRNCFDRALSIISSGKIDLKRLITKTYPFADSIAAYDFASKGDAKTVKVMIDF